MKTCFLIAITLVAAVAAVMFPAYSVHIAGAAALGMAIQAAQGPLTDRVRPYELMRWEPDQRYTRTAGTVKNPSTSTLAAGGLVVGMPLKLVTGQWTIVLSTDEANTGGLFLGDDAHGIPEALAQNAITAKQYPILVRGPALVNKSVIPATDPAGASYSLANIVTALAGLTPPVLTLVEPSGGLGIQTN